MGFANVIVRRHIIKPLASLICMYIRPIPSIDLGDMIDGGWSLVESIKLRSHEELMANIDKALQKDELLYSFYRSYKHKQFQVEESKADGFDIAEGLDLGKLIDYIFAELPDHGMVLQKHMDWVESEIGRIKELLK